MNITREEILTEIPHRMVEYINANDEIQWNLLKSEFPEIYNQFCELTTEEIDKCIKEIYKSGNITYGPIIDALQKQREDVENMHIRIP